MHHDGGDKDNSKTKHFTSVTADFAPLIYTHHYLAHVHQIPADFCSPGKQKYECKFMKICFKLSIFNNNLKGLPKVSPKPSEQSQGTNTHPLG